MYEIVIDALKDTAKMIPLLFVIYVTIEYLEHNYSHKIREKIEKSGKASPVLGAVAGSLPQCGFSVLSTALYTKRYMTIGTLISVYISTSDEAIPVFLAHPEKAGIIIPLIISKIILAITAGYMLDLFVKPEIKLGKNDECIDEKGCCGHVCDSDKLSLKEIIYHPLVHTIKIFFYILIFSIILNLAIKMVGVDNFNKLFLAHKSIQPLIASIIGLIPNCAASVIIAQLYLNNTIGFGSTIAGLSAGAGLGLIILFKENKNTKNSLFILFFLLSFSVLAGILIQFFYK